MDKKTRKYKKKQQLGNNDKKNSNQQLRYVLQIYVHQAGSNLFRLAEEEVISENSIRHWKKIGKKIYNV